MKRFSPISTIEPKQVLDYWFGDAATNPDIAQQKKRLWYRSNTATDTEISEQFGTLLDRAANGYFDQWCGETRSALALVIVLDQFSRHIHRGTALAFSQDAKALEIVSVLPDDQQLSLIEQAFFYHPYKHAECRESQARSVALFKNLVKKSNGGWRPIMNNFYNNALKHQEIVNEFGRFPHRNRILSRPSTDQELAYLTAHPGNFGQRKR